jgi:DNA-binding transcriptional ArsR family regulator
VPDETAVIDPPTQTNGEAAVPKPKKPRAKGATRGPADTPAKRVQAGESKPKARPKGKPSPSQQAVRHAAIREAAELIKQAADATRLAVLMILRDHPAGMSVNGMQKELGLASQPALSHHLNLVRTGRIVRFDRRGKESIYTLTDEGRRLIGAIGALVAGG